jgi:hypothetical protein
MAMVVKLVSERNGDHVQQQVFVGEDEDHLALAGTLMFRIGEWQLFGAALALGAKQTMGQLRVLHEGDEQMVVG